MIDQCLRSSNILTLREVEEDYNKGMVLFFHHKDRDEKIKELDRHAPDFLDLTHQEKWEIPGYWDKSGYLYIENPPLWFAQLFHHKGTFQITSEYPPMTWREYLWDKREELFPGTTDFREALTARAGEKINPFITFIKS